MRPLPSLFKVRHAAFFALLAASVCPVAAQPPKEKPPMILTATQHKQLMQALAPMNAHYDAKEQMLGSPFSSPGYHTTLTGGTVHSTRDSLQYAAALLDTGDPDLEQRAVAILRRVVALQDQNPDSKTYGIWSWFLEEPLDKMSPPDWNWADFCGVPLLQVALFHRSKMPADLMTAIDTAIHHAAASIRRRNVGPSYTNIALMGTYVTLVTAETYHDADLKKYATERLHRFYEYSLQNGGFTEFNSPTYTIVALKEVARLRRDVQDKEAEKEVEAVYRMAWEEIAQHFHVPTRQWSGPHSRTYFDLLGTDVLALVERSSNGRVSFGIGDTKASIDQHRVPTLLPRDLEPYFTTLDTPRELRKTFVRSGTAPVIGTTYLSPLFALGSINRGDLWNQRRPLLAYWGDAKNPSYLRVRFLHDGYDFTAVRFNGVQNKGRVLAALEVASDGGDRHPSLDPIKNGTITAKDLRLRFEFGGAAAARALAVPSGDPAAPFHLAFDNLSVAIAVPYARFDGLMGHWETGHDAKTAFLDFVLYTGNARLFDLKEQKQAAFGIVLQMGDESEPLPRVQVTIGSNRLNLVWNDLRADAALYPAPAAALNQPGKAAP